MEEPCGQAQAWLDELHQTIRAPRSISPPPTEICSKTWWRSPEDILQAVSYIDFYHESCPHLIPLTGAQGTMCVFNTGSGCLSSPKRRRFSDPRDATLRVLRMKRKRPRRRETSVQVSGTERFSLGIMSRLSPKRWPIGLKQ
ncbi:hypothetical protein EYF80_014968 [Liparis tanakae]|uniref:Uncharacterized protein n=1 Tax=Liparis tanakae TaxID=230148 RepID=A0A4Z2IA60_9TELE|nr:hypothetical protein EYF80_014968 [Liparis tanakae]